MSVSDPATARATHSRTVTATGRCAAPRIAPPFSSRGRFLLLVAAISRPRPAARAGVMASTAGEPRAPGAGSPASGRPSQLTRAKAAKPIVSSAVRTRTTIFPPLPWDAADAPAECDRADGDHRQGHGEERPGVGGRSGAPRAESRIATTATIGSGEIAMPTARGRSEESSDIGADATRGVDPVAGMFGPHDRTLRVGVRVDQEDGFEHRVVAPTDQACARALGPRTRPQAHPRDGGARGDHAHAQTRPRRRRRQTHLDARAPHPRVLGGVE